jgi:cellulase/cellobiase CelA1
MGALIRTAVAAVAGVALAGTISATPAAADDIQRGNVTCTYVLNATWNGGFMGTIFFVNNGPQINGWTIRWSWDTPTTLQQSWGVQGVQQGDEVIATSLSYNSVIQTGWSASFGWTGLAQSTTIPTVITINGVPC